MLKEKNSKMVSYLLLIVYIFASSLGMVLIKKGGNISRVSIGKSDFSVQISWLFLIGIIFYVLSFILWVVILQLFPLTYISPVAYGLVFIAIAIFSYVILDTKITKMQLISAFLIILGIIIGTIGSKQL